GDALALGRYEGFTPATPDLAQGRWTMGDGRVRVRGSCGDLVLWVRGPAGRALRVSVENGPGPQSFVLTGQEQDIRFSLAGLPACSASPAIVVRLQSATSLLDIERAPWMGGVAVLQVRAEGR
ncbi:MAG TPA: hypothetical protein VFT99_09665, partial [Roseiflexaceae bacterium]|nr:hypothetical protein [Roseiflexaceae bacterium]